MLFITTINIIYEKIMIIIKFKTLLNKPIFSFLNLFNIIIINFFKMKYINITIKIKVLFSLI